MPILLEELKELVHGWNYWGSLAEEEVEVVDVLQRNARTNSYGVQWVLCDLEVQAEALGETLVQTTQERTTTGEDDAVSDDVRIEFGGSSLEGAEDSTLDLADGVVEAFHGS